MRIAHVVSLVTPEGSYGGPVRVAINQARELIAQGHHVTVFAGTIGCPSGMKVVDGVQVRLFSASKLIPGIGFAGITSFGLLGSVRKHIHDFDVWHVHMARDFITLLAADMLRRAKQPFVLQCHGMVDPTSRLLAAPLDWAFTRPILVSALAVLALTPRERIDLRQVAKKDIAVFDVVNGVPRSTKTPTPNRNDVEALFLARLHSRKRPLAFLESAQKLALESTRFRFALVGPDEGQGQSVQKMIGNSPSSSQMRWEGALSPEETLGRMKDANIFVLPSVDEPFPMSVLEALSLGIPVIITDSCGLAPFVAEARAGLVVDDTQESLTDAMRTLMTNEEQRLEFGHNGRRLIEQKFSMESVAVTLLHHYDRISGSR